MSLNCRVALLGELSGRVAERREARRSTGSRLQGRVEKQKNVGEAQRTDDSQSSSDPLTRDGHHEHGITNTFDIQATRTLCSPYICLFH
jgi:hypothetical protein